MLRVRICKITGCWLYEGARNKDGYGMVWDLRVKRANGVHIVVFQHYNGPVLDGVMLCHTCDVRHCCNPEHLIPNTQTFNMRDMMAKGRGKNQFKAKAEEEEVDDCPF